MFMLKILWVYKCFSFSRSISSSFKIDEIKLFFFLVLVVKG